MKKEKKLNNKVNTTNEISISLIYYFYQMKQLKHLTKIQCVYNNVCV